MFSYNVVATNVAPHYRRQVSLDCYLHLRNLRQANAEHEYGYHSLVFFFFTSQHIVICHSKYISVHR